MLCLSVVDFEFDISCISVSRIWHINQVVGTKLLEIHFQGC